jgi:hypothetical protein
MDEVQRTPVRSYLACYALYIGLIALSVMVVFGVWRNTIDMLVVRFVQHTWQYNAYQTFSMLILTVAAFVLIIGAEPYLRHGAEQNQLLKRFGKMVLPLVIAGIVGILLQVWVQVT